MGIVTTSYMFQPVLETLARPDLRRLQLERLQKVLGYVWSKVPYYRERFTAAGVRPDHLRHLEDLSRFPFTVKDDLRCNYPFGLFAVPLDQVPRIHVSSGTTGKPTVVGYSKRDLETWSDVVARSIRAAGGRAGPDGPHPPVQADGVASDVDGRTADAGRAGRGRCAR